MMRRLSCSLFFLVLLAAAAPCQAKPAQPIPQKTADLIKAGLSLEDAGRLMLGSWTGVVDGESVLIWFYAKDKVLISDGRDKYKVGRYRLRKGESFFVIELQLGGDANVGVFDLIDENHLVLEMRIPADPDERTISEGALLERRP